VDNRRIARELTRLARYLTDRKASLYRARAYRRAAETVLDLDEPVEAIVACRGRKGLEELPGIGRGISETIESLLRDSSSQGCGLGN
jgi:DNA polymerase/3'-5' exonuclease PolX